MFVSIEVTATRNVQPPVQRASSVRLRSVLSSFSILYCNPTITFETRPSYNLSYNNEYLDTNDCRVLKELATWVGILAGCLF